MPQRHLNGVPRFVFKSNLAATPSNHPSREIIEMPDSSYASDAFVDSINNAGTLELGGYKHHGRCCVMALDMGHSHRNGGVGDCYMVRETRNGSRLDFTPYRVDTYGEEISTEGFDRATTVQSDSSEINPAQVVDRLRGLNIEVSETIAQIHDRVDNRRREIDRLEALHMEDVRIIETLSSLGNAIVSSIKGPQESVVSEGPFVGIAPTPAHPSYRDRF